MKKRSVLGIDLGTSSVKVLQRFEDGTIAKGKAGYREISEEGWWNAVQEALLQLELDSVEAIGLSSQVGTYIVDDTWINSWNSGIGSEQLTWLKQQISQEEFFQEISMPHPNITSYPLPRLKYMSQQYPKAKQICQPKDFICEKLTGNRVTDPYSWRGLVNLHTGEYSGKLLDFIGFSVEKLPKIQSETQLAGYTKELFPKKVPVYTGLNDFFAALLGMGICQEGDMFDISGTSEHVGVLEKHVNIETPLVSGPYLRKNVHYGVTASSGTSLDFGLHLMGEKALGLEDVYGKKLPIFLPYLSGERAPIWDMDARGVFMGITAGCTKEELSYSVMEGVVFSLYHIYEIMGKPKAARMKAAGGAAVNPLLNMLKAELFGIPVEVLEEKDSSALGAAMVASVGNGWFENYEEAIKEMCRIQTVTEPTGKYREWLLKRFSVYKELYPAVKEQYKTMRRLEL